MMTYNPDMNNTKHYYAGKKPIKNARVKSVFAGSCDVKDKYCSGSKVNSPKRPKNRPNRSIKASISKPRRRKRAVSVFARGM